MLTQEQLELFLGQLPEKYSVLAEVMYFTAGRVKEICTLKVRSINFQDGLLTIEKASTKTKETRQVPLPRTVLEHLRSWIHSKELGPDDYIFYTDSKNTSYRPGEKAYLHSPWISSFGKPLIGLVSLVPAHIAFVEQG